MKACVFCGQRLAPTLSLTRIFSYQPFPLAGACGSCRNSFEPIDLQTACTGCSRPQKDPTFCSDCQRWARVEPNVAPRHTALFAYNKKAKEFMQRYKFQGDVVLAQLFTEAIKEALASYQHTHHIVPIPISQASRAQRGFNQTTQLLKTAGVRYETWLEHIGNGPRQASKNRENRLLTPQFLTVCVENHADFKIKKPIVLVDDVYTTGRTILHAKNAFQTEQKMAKKGPFDEHFDQAMEVESFSLFR